MCFTGFEREMLSSFVLNVSVVPMYFGMKQGMKQSTPYTPICRKEGTPRNVTQRSFPRLLGCFPRKRVWCVTPTKLKKGQIVTKMFIRFTIYNPFSVLGIVPDVLGRVKPETGTVVPVDERARS